MSSSYDIPGWPTIRKAIILRDEGQCRMCKKQYYLEVHHIDWDRKNNKHCNLVTLCRYCHRAVHREAYRPWQYDNYPAPWDKTDPDKIDMYNQEHSW